MYQAELALTLLAYILVLSHAMYDLWGSWLQSAKEHQPGTQPQFGAACIKFVQHAGNNSARQLEHMLCISISQR
jgi:hypothetical protein